MSSELPSDTAPVAAPSAAASAGAGRAARASTPYSAKPGIEIRRSWLRNSLTTYTEPIAPPSALKPPHAALSSRSGLSRSRARYAPSAAGAVPMLLTPVARPCPT